MIREWIESIKLNSIDDAEIQAALDAEKLFNEIEKLHGEIMVEDRIEQANKIMAELVNDHGDPTLQAFAKDAHDPLKQEHYLSHLNEVDHPEEAT